MKISTKFFSIFIVLLFLHSEISHVSGADDEASQTPAPAPEDGPEGEPTETTVGSSTVTTKQTVPATTPTTTTTKLTTTSKPTTTKPVESTTSGAVHVITSSTKVLAFIFTAIAAHVIN